MTYTPRVTAADPDFATSLDAATLTTLLGEWHALHHATPTPVRTAAIRALAHRIVAHRMALFAENARLQADAPRDDDPTMVAQTAANQAAIKACTNALAEMVGALGHAAIPA